MLSESLSNNLAIAMERWNGKVALVTGASVGIGEAIAKTLAKNGMIVVACARNVSKLETIASSSEGTIVPIKCDMQNEDEILTMFQIIKQKFGCVHVCVNNAGLAHKAGSYILTGKTQVNICQNDAICTILVLKHELKFKHFSLYPSYVLYHTFLFRDGKKCSTSTY